MRRQPESLGEEQVEQDDKMRRMAVRFLRNSSIARIASQTSDANGFPVRVEGVSFLAVIPDSGFKEFDQGLADAGRLSGSGTGERKS